MTDTPIELIVDCSTGETIERELTPEEIAAREAEAAEFAAQQAAAEAEAAAKAAERAALLSRLGLTEDEAKLLLG